MLRQRLATREIVEMSVPAAYGLARPIHTNEVEKIDALHAERYETHTLGLTAAPTA